MSVTEKLSIPQNTCAYSQYDLMSLAPTNEQTEFRLRDLGWTRDDFVNRTVLDIGCNSGILSVLACQLGAKHVKAIDPNPSYIESLNRVTHLHRDLRISATCETLGDLDLDRNVFDIVLFMEVLHWAVDQGMPVNDVVYRLWRITRDVLYIEFPWSIDEPSIKSQTTLTEDRYSAILIFEELARAFDDLNIVGFMHYVGLGKDSKRVLVRAASPRREYGLVRKHENAFSMNKLGERSTNYVAPIYTSDGMRFYKEFSPHSSLARLSVGDAEMLLKTIADSKPACLVAPLPIDGHHLNIHNGLRSALFPLISRRRINLHEFGSVQISEIVNAAISLRNDLRKVNMRDSLRDADSLRRVFDVNHANILVALAGVERASGQLSNFLDVGLANYNSKAVEICHGDLQEGNIIVSSDGTLRVVDLDGLCFGTAFTDMICALIWAGAGTDMFEVGVGALESSEGRSCTIDDCGIAILLMTLWFEAIAGLQTAEAASLGLQARKAVANLVTFWARRETLRG